VRRADSPPTPPPCGQDFRGRATAGTWFPGAAKPALGRMAGPDVGATTNTFDVGDVEDIVGAPPRSSADQGMADGAAKGCRPRDRLRPPGDPARIASLVLPWPRRSLPHRSRRAEDGTFMGRWADRGAHDQQSPQDDHAHGLCPLCALAEIALLVPNRKFGCSESPSDFSARRAHVSGNGHARHRPWCPATSGHVGGTTPGVHGRRGGRRVFKHQARWCGSCPSVLPSLRETVTAGLIEGGRGHKPGVGWTAGRTFGRQACAGRRASVEISRRRQAGLGRSPPVAGGGRGGVTSQSLWRREVLHGQAWPTSRWRRRSGTFWASWKGPLSHNPKQSML